MANSCPKCGRSSAGFWCECGQDLRNVKDTGEQIIVSYAGSPQMLNEGNQFYDNQYHSNNEKPVKEKGITIILALLLGGLGVHRFYLGNLKTGLVYLLFCWTLIPAIISFVEIVLIVFASKERERVYSVKWKT